DHGSGRRRAWVRVYLKRRCENFSRGNTDLDDTIRELKGCEDAGAEVLMASGLPDREAVKTVCSALSKPFNFMVGIPGWAFDVASLRATGVRRISLARLSMRRQKPATKTHPDLSKRVCPRRTWTDS
ncbi:MAG: isocitrate lyase/phosphoenolpyruvate mutase family protein, partial [Pseudomonadota bacterium]|nr:isocitrate lyase/phosphoenolpyruvate mutase family protein [Pseudomonadota bacterium]